MSGLDYADLAVYAPLVLPVLFLTYKHGLPGITGWLYLYVFCILRIVGPALQIKDNTDHTLSTTPALISSIGLSPLLLAIVGILHEARRYRKPEFDSSWEWVVVLVVHIVVGGGIALLASGSDGFSGASASSALIRLKIGVAILEISWVGIFAFALFSLGASQSNRNAPAHRSATKLLHGILLVLPFIGIRVTYTLVEICTNIERLTKGSLGLRIGLGFIPEVFVALGLAGVGFSTRKIALERRQAESVQLMSRSSSHPEQQAHAIGK